MKKSRIIIAAVLYCSLLNAQSSGVKANTREVIINKGDTIVKANILAGQKKKRIVPDLVYFWYLKGTISSNSGGYSGKLLNGSFQEIVRNRLITSGQFKEGIKTGQWESWYESGRVKEVSNWHEGLLDGKYLLMGEDGKVKESATYTRGKLRNEAGGKRRGKIFLRNKPEKSDDIT